MSQPDRPPTVVRRRLSPFQISLSGMAVIVLCCAAVLWSYRRVRENEHPSIARAHMLRSGDRDERLDAARFFLVSEPSDPEFTAAALIDALKDEDVTVRSEAVRALGAVAKRLMGPPPVPESGPAIKALITVLLGRNAESRAPDSSNLARAVGDPATPASGKPDGDKLHGSSPAPTRRKAATWAGRATHR